jgi:L-asparaginase
MKPDAIFDDLVISQAHTAPARREADTNSPAQLASRETIQPWTGAALEGGRGDRHWLPRVDYLAAGGTIATVHDAGPDSGGEPTLTAETLARSLPGIDEVAELRPAQFMQRPSPSITFADLLRLRDEISMRIADGCAGVVITQGTDTIEETAFALDLLSAGSTPIVVTGAMRSPSLPGADGPANLLAAIQVAASPVARGLGVLVVFNDEIHAARFVAKTHTSKPSAFQSRLTGPIGWLSERQPVIVTRPVGRFCLKVPSGTDVPPVALVRVALDDDGRILPTLTTHGFRGVVIEGFGGGHVTPAMVSRIERLATEMPVVLASRTGSGELLRSTYRYRGSETELLEAGAIPAGLLDGLKALILLSLCLASDPAGGTVAAAFESIGMASTRKTRLDLDEARALEGRTQPACHNGRITDRGDLPTIGPAGRPPRERSGRAGALSDVLDRPPMAKPERPCPACGRGCTVRSVADYAASPVAVPGDLGTEQMITAAPS